MTDDYPLTQLEYAKILGLSKEALRSRRRAGKLEGLYKVIDDKYFYKRVRPHQVKTIPDKPPKRPRRRGVHYSDTPTVYKSAALQQHNEAKMLAKLQYNADKETLDLLPEALNVAREMKAKRIREATFAPTKKGKSNIYKMYGWGIYHTKNAPPHYYPIGLTVRPVKKEKVYY